MLKWLKRIFGYNKTEIPQRVESIVSLQDIKLRLFHQGWHLKEIPIRKGIKIASWRIIASRNNRTFSLDGTSLDESIRLIGRILGVTKR